MATWWVTGASRGLGAALVGQLAHRGHRVLALARTGSGAARSGAGENNAARVAFEPLDLRDAAGLAVRVQRLVEHHGTPDGVLHNAGIGWYRPLLEHHDSDLRDILQVNLTSVIQITRVLLPGMLQRGSGQIMAIGSDLGRRPLANMAAYVASKHGLTGFMHSLLREVRAQGIRVSLIQPGMIDTEFGGGHPGSHAPGSVLKPEVLARLIVQLIEQPDEVVVDELTVHPLRQHDF